MLSFSRCIHGIFCAEPRVTRRFAAVHKRSAAPAVPEAHACRLGIGTKTYT
jgi:hypothetical protein